MVAIGDYELAVLKALATTDQIISEGGEHPEFPALSSGSIEDAISKLCEAEYLEKNDKNYTLTDLAIEYLELLGISTDPTET